ncbi:MAG: hypothetical protein M0035_03365, partial [Actinomycetota bacterium]|nr:hypothetical protein [Actinomycetota bacterium]
MIESGESYVILNIVDLARPQPVEPDAPQLFGQPSTAERVVARGVGLAVRADVSHPLLEVRG